MRGRQRWRGQAAVAAALLRPGASAAGGAAAAAEAAAAEAGLAAWVQGGEVGSHGAVTDEQRLCMEQLRAVMEQRQAAGQPLRRGGLMGSMMGLQMAAARERQPQGQAPAGAPPGPGECVVS